MLLGNVTTNIYVSTHYVIQLHHTYNDVIIIRLLGATNVIMHETIRIMNMCHCVPDRPGDSRIHCGKVLRQAND